MHKSEYYQEKRFLNKKKCQSKYENDFLFPAKRRIMMCAQWGIMMQ